MTGPRPHPWGCTCKTHVDRPWRRSEHWTTAEVEILDRSFGHRTDKAIAKQLGRTVVAVRLKAKRLGMHKRTAGFTARSVGEIFGVDGSTIGKVWIRRGLLRARRAAVREYDGRVVHWIVSGTEVEAFITRHPELVDVEKMPESYYRALAARDPWIGLAEVHRLTGRPLHAIARLIADGVLRGRKRGQYWYVPASEVGRIRHLAPEAIAESVFRRVSTLEHRRLVRKRAELAAAS